MLTYFQAIILGLFQGLTELFPVSSLGHSVILPQLLGWHVDESNNFFLIFLVATHFATSLALLTFFFEDWMLIIKGLFRPLKNAENKENTDEGKYTKLAWLIIIGTIPAGLVGLIFQNKLQALFASPRLAALFLIGNGLMLWGIENMHRKRKNNALATGKGNEENDIARLTWMQSAKVGLAQCVALIPGFSRTGATMAGGKLVGLSHEAAAYFAFLLATPIIFAAALLKLPQLAHDASAGGMAVVGPLFAGSVVSFAAAYFSARFLVRYFKTKNLMPFAVYCIAFGAFASAVFLFVH